MENFINKLERRFGRFAIHNFMNYIIGVYGLGTLIGFLAPNFYYSYLALDFSMIAKGQVWRLVTFILEPFGSLNSGLFSLLFLVIELYFYFMIGRHLENAWGAFRFNLYYFSGILLQIIAGLVMYLITKNPMSGYYFGLSYINESLFLAFCVLYPNVQLLLFFIIPIKVKYIGIFYGALLGISVVRAIFGGSWYMGVAIIVSVANFLIFYFSTRNYRRVDPREVHRRNVYKKAVQQPKGITRHKCAVCGRTELDDPNLEFRFCSKCNGNYEYCQDHLFTHTHVQ